MLIILPPKRLYIMQGIPGSGKSTVARDLAAMVCPGHTVAILSTDDYWLVPHELPGAGFMTQYKYDPAKATEAHMWNQRRCVEEMQKETNHIFIDNTNIEKWQAAPYVSVAKMFSYEIQVISVSCGLEEAKRRNRQRDSDRRVPDDVIESMHSRLEPLL